jgi:non-ribosomal peptide synthetase component F
MTLLSGFAALLYQYTGQDEVVVGSVIANREREEVEQLIGFVANTLVLRVNVGGEPSFGELMRRVRETCLGAYAHQMPPEKLVEGLGRQEQRLYDIWFQLESASREQLEFGGVKWEPWEIRNPANVFELSLVLYETQNGVAGRIEHDPNLFSENMIQQVARDYVLLLRKLVATPDAKFAGLSLATCEEEAQLAMEFAESLDA